MKLHDDFTIAALGCSLALVACSADSGRDGGLTTAGTLTAGTATSASSGGSGPSSGSADGSGDGSGDGTDSATASGTDGVTASGTGDDGGTRFDVGTVTDLPTNPTDSGGEQGCKKIDFLFVIDNSGSMSDEQMNLANSFPGFINSISNTVMAQDYHILVVDSDADSAAGGGSSSSCSIGGGGATCTCSPAPGCCTQVCSNYGPTATCNGMPACTPPPPPPGGTPCDVVLGAGKTKDQSDNDCGIVGGNRYMLDTQPNIGTTFSCVALVGTQGDGNERPMEGMVEAVTTQNQTGECNEAFVRDDALLVVTFITDEEDNGKSIGTPVTWKDALVQAKNGDETAIVLLGLIGDPDVPGGYCAMAGNADASPNLRSFAESFTYGSWGSVCEPDYAPFFDMAVGAIDTACDEFEPPG